MTIIKSDNIGIASGVMCLAHCIATPFIFVIHACCSEGVPLWWQTFDLLFLIVSFLAVYFSSRNSSNIYIIFGLWISWFSVCLFLMNEHFLWISVNHSFIYMPTALLIALHIYNLRYCQFKKGDCCEASSKEY